jgi:hypothetical protein
MESLHDRCRQNTLMLLAENRRIITAMENGTLINWSAERLDRLQALVSELEALLESARSS